MNVVKEVRQPCLDIDSGKFAAAHNRVHHGRILCCIVVLAEEVVLARQRNDTLPVLNKIGVDSVPAVDDITAQAVVVGDRIVDGLAFIIVVHGIAVRLERAPEVCKQPQSHVLCFSLSTIGTVVSSA